jgi:hypothetical protein
LQPLRDFDAERLRRLHPRAPGILALQTADRLDRRRRIVRLMLTVRQPEQRFRLAGFLGVVGRGLQFINRANPLLVRD